MGGYVLNLTNAINDYTAVVVKWKENRLHFTGHVVLENGTVYKDNRDIDIGYSKYLQFIYEAKTMPIYKIKPIGNGLYITHVSEDKQKRKEVKNPDDYKGKVRNVFCAVCGVPFKINNRTEKTRVFIVNGREVALCHIHRPIVVNRSVYEWVNAIKQIPVGMAAKLENVDIQKLRYYVHSHKIDIGFKTIQGITFAYNLKDAELVK